MSSYEPVGLVAQTLVGDRFLRHVKTDTDLTATALAGLILSISERHPASLTQVFGKIAQSRTAQSEGADRAPIRRVEALPALLAAAGPLTQAELARTSGMMNSGGLSVVVVAMRDARLISYEAQPTYELKSRYRCSHPSRSRPEARTSPARSLPTSMGCSSSVGSRSS